MNPRPPGPSLADYVRAATFALDSGRSLMEEYLELEHRGGYPRFELQAPQDSLLAMQGYFGQRRDGTTVMGCLQSAGFAAPSVLGPELPLREAPRVYREHSSYLHPDGSNGGFTYTPVVLWRTHSPGPQPARSEDVDFLLEGMDWLVLRVDIHDFVRGIPPLRRWAGTLGKVVREAALVVVHRDFGRTAVSLPPGVVAEVAFGYSFLPLAPEPNIFGFGPGHFGAAVKRFRFQLRSDGGLNIELLFTVSPRSEKILNLRGFDPVYAGIRWIDRLTFRRLGLEAAAHCRFDETMLRIHGRVHHLLLDDLRVEWERRRWVP
jgi:hypothetical protein